MRICRRNSSKWQFYGGWCRGHPWSGFGGFGQALWDKMWMLCDHWLLRFGHVSHQVPSCSAKLKPAVGKGEEGLNLRLATFMSHDTCCDNAISEVWRCKALRTRSFTVMFCLFWDKFSCGWCWLKRWHFSITCISVNCDEHPVQFYGFQG